MTARPELEFEKNPGLVHIDHVDENEVDRIAELFVDRCLFITGGTGFLGKVLVEKLLRSCGDLKKIYLLVRAKKGKQPIDRVKEMFNNVLFDKVKEQKGEDIIFSKVQAIEGDVMLPNLGISEEDTETLCNNVSIVYHCAATVRFDEPLRRAVFLNVRGTKYMLDLASSMKCLDCFFYISTAYCHLDVKTLYEKPYDPPADPHKVLAAFEWLSDDEVDLIEKKVLGDVPNTYAYSKSLAEALVVEKFNEIPAGILRPSIVIPIWREPVPGWTDNINGPTGILIGAGKGVIRTMYCKSTGYGDFLPVDVAVNGIVVSTWRGLSKDLEPPTTRVANLTSSNEVKVSWAEVVEIGRWVIENKVPLNYVAWYPGGSLKSNYILHWLSVMLFHYLPAIFVDICLRVIGYPPVLMKVQNRISKGFEVFEYYANNVWHFNNSETLKVRKLMNNKERMTYVVEKIDIDLIDYFTNCVLCARRLLLNESDESIPAAKRHMKIMWYVDKLLKAMLLFGLCYVVYRYFFSDFIDDYFGSTATFREQMEAI